jgi:hypothetical protein
MNVYEQTRLKKEKETHERVSTLFEYEMDWW